MPGHIKMYICLSVGQLTGYTPMHWQILQCSIFSMSLGFWGRSGHKQFSCKWGDVKKHDTSVRSGPDFAKFANLWWKVTPPPCTPLLLLLFSFLCRVEEEMGTHDMYFCASVHVYFPFPFEWMLRKMLGFGWVGEGRLCSVTLSNRFCKCPVTSSVGLAATLKEGTFLIF